MRSRRRRRRRRGLAKRRLVKIGISTGLLWDGSASERAEIVCARSGRFFRGRRRIFLGTLGAVGAGPVCAGASSGCQIALPRSVARDSARRAEVWHADCLTNGRQTGFGEPESSVLVFEFRAL
jgi:hypothetical protein